MTLDEILIDLYLRLHTADEARDLIDGIMWREINAHVAAEREACAAICDELESFWSAEKDVALLSGDVALSNASSGEPRAARAIAKAIRARGEK